MDAVPDDGAVVIGEVGALAPAEALAPVQGARQAPVGLGGEHAPVGPAASDTSSSVASVPPNVIGGHQPSGPSTWAAASQ